MLAVILDQFKTYLKLERGVSPHTYDAYSRDISQFINFVEPGSLSQDAVNDYLHYLSTRYGSASTLRRKRSAVKQFLSYARSESFTEITPYISKLKGRSTLPKGISKKELTRLFTYLYTEDVSKRDIALVELIYSAALRVSELVTISIDDFDLESDALKVHGKGSKDRFVPLHSKAKEAVQAYILSERVASSTSDAPLFTNAKGNAFTRQGIYTLLRSLSLRAAVPPCHPHQFRHACATHLLENGAPLLEIQALLGHDSITTTQRYTSVSSVQLKKVYQEAHPRI